MLNRSSGSARESREQLQGEDDIHPVERVDFEPSCIVTSEIGASLSSAVPPSNRTLDRQRISRGPHQDVARPKHPRALRIRHMDFRNEGSVLPFAAHVARNPDHSPPGCALSSASELIFRRFPIGSYDRLSIFEELKEIDQQDEAISFTIHWLSRPMESGSHAFLPLGPPGPCELKMA